MVSIIKRTEHKYPEEHKNRRSSDIDVREEASTPSSYLNDLIHRSLSAPCAGEIGKLVDNSKIVARSSVEFSKYNTLYTSSVAKGNSKSGYKKKAFGNFNKPIMGENHASI